MELSAGALNGEEAKYRYGEYRVVGSLGSRVDSEAFEVGQKRDDKGCRQHCITMLRATHLRSRLS